MQLLKVINQRLPFTQATQCIDVRRYGRAYKYIRWHSQIFRVAKNWKKLRKKMEKQAFIYNNRYKIKIYMRCTVRYSFDALFLRCFQLFTIKFNYIMHSDEQFYRKIMGVIRAWP